MVVMVFSFLSLSFGPKIIPEAIFNNQGNDECGMRKGRLYWSGYLPLEIRLCPMGYGDDVRDMVPYAISPDQAAFLMGTDSSLTIWRDVPYG